MPDPLDVTQETRSGETLQDFPQPDQMEWEASAAWQADLLQLERAERLGWL